MAERTTGIFADQIADLALGDGVAKNSTDDTKFEVALKADAGLAFDTGEIEVEVDDVTIEIDSTNGVQVKDGGVAEVKLDIDGTPSTGYFLKWNGSKMEWADVDTNAVMDDDVICNEIPSGLINSTNTAYTIANTPVSGTLMVFLNGMLQGPAGVDYTLSGVTVTFNKAPRTNSELYVSYVKS